MRWYVLPAACLVSLVMVGCAWYLPQPMSDPFGPGVAVWWPADERAVRGDTEVVLVFDRDMDRNAVGRSLRVSPPLPVVIVWEDDRRCRIVPGGVWPGGEVRVQLQQGATDRRGQGLRLPFVLTFVIDEDIH